MAPVHAAFTGINITGLITVHSPSVTHGITSWLPLTTAGQPHTESSSYIYNTSNHDSGDTFLASETSYSSQELRSADTLFPHEVTTLWQHGKSPTTTSLGHEFVCPEAYCTVTTSDIDECLKQMFCCPSELLNTQFRAISPPTGSPYPSQTGNRFFPSPNITTTSSRCTIEYQHLEQILTTTITEVMPDETSSVVAAPVNGLVYISPTGSHSTASGPEPTMSPTTSVTTTPAISSPPKVQIPATTTLYSTLSAGGQSPGSKGSQGRYSQSDKISLGVGIGVGLGVGVPTLILAFVQYRRTELGAKMVIMVRGSIVEKTGSEIYPV
ncbi:hypothetical protein F4859DRAFT_527780 [Xylaria cf. heliscus]|nr:hypothetical protein F4859DRAFT_527780 [Xylaria cf. heliscus]